MDWLGPRAAWAGPADLLFFWYGLGHNGPSAPDINPTILLDIGPFLSWPPVVASAAWP
jgi:hypothetical protein